VFVPVGLLLFTSFPLNALALGIPWFAMLALSGAALGPLVGGYFSETFGAGAIYLPSAVAMLVALSLAWTHAPDVDSPQRQYRFDVTGIALSLVMFGAMQYLANEGERRNWFDDPSVTFAASSSSLQAWPSCFGSSSFRGIPTRISTSSRSTVTSRSARSSTSYSAPSATPL
jgi:MFS family permease